MKEKGLPSDDEIFVMSQKSERIQDTNILNEDCFRLKTPNFFRLKTPDFLSEERLTTFITPSELTGLKV